MPRRPAKGSRFLVALFALAAATASLVVPAVTSAPAGAATIARPEGAGPPVAASGMGTTAALQHPRCRKTNPSGDVLGGGYGRFDSTVIGGGPVCVKPWKAGADNGGATWQGVTKDKVTVVAVLPNDTQLESDPVTPKHKADKSASTYEDAVHDYVIPQMKFYETWGRDLEIKFVKSSGSDEAAQRADVVTIKAMKPFAVFHLIVAGLDVLETELAKAHIPTMGYSTTSTKANLQAPYRWGLSDAQSSAINSAEVIGKQLVGKKAEYAGDELKKQTRKIGVVYIKTLVDYPQFEEFFKKYGGTVTSENVYDANGSIFGDSAVSAEQAPTMVTRMKAAGVTTVVLLSDMSMNKASMKQADEAGVVPRVVVHRRGVLRHRHPLAHLPAGAVGCTCSVCRSSPVHRARPATAAAAGPVVDADGLAELVLGVDVGTQAVPWLAHRVVGGHPGRGAEADAEDVRGGAFVIPGRAAPRRTA